jgi:hypothetical protein
VGTEDEGGASIDSASHGIVEARRGCIRSQLYYLAPASRGKTYTTYNTYGTHAVRQLSTVLAYP